MNIATLIGIFITIIVAINLIVPTTSVVENAASNQSTSPIVSSLLNIMPILFVMIVIIGAIASFYGTGIHILEKDKTVDDIIKNPKWLYNKLNELSKPYQQYINNLDEYLGIKTIESKHTDRLSLVNKTSLYNQKINKPTLYISNDYNWYIIDRKNGERKLTVIGLHKEYKSENKAYYIGTDGKEPYIKKLQVHIIEENNTDNSISELAILDNSKNRLTTISKN